MRLRGWVYIITNDGMPELIKIGYSMKDPWLRAEELANTGAAHPYRVLYDALTFEPRDIEQSTHAKLASRRVGREWFSCSVDDAIQAILDVIREDSLLVETHHRTEGPVVSTAGAKRSARLGN